MPHDRASYLELIRGARRGPLADAARAWLRAASWAFGAGARARGWAYDAGLLEVAAAPVPTVSVGNLTTGGTGKTPLVILLARALVARGDRPGVLARGYGAARDGEPNDELRLVAREVPDALVLPGRDRAARAAEAVARGATALVLDDAFQHRRLARDLDVVLVDATDPWGPAGALLPRGLLREPLGALARADWLVLSRLDLAGPGAADALEATARAAGFRGRLARLALAPRALVPLGGRPTGGPAPGAGAPGAALAGRRVLAAAGIGNPAAFARGLEALGARVVEVAAFPDHHAYDGDDVLALARRARALEAAVVVTAKDAVKLEPLLATAPPGAHDAPFLRLDVDASLEPAGALDDLLDALEEAATARLGPPEGRALAPGPAPARLP